MISFCKRINNIEFNKNRQHEWFHNYNIPFSNLFHDTWVWRNNHDTKWINHNQIKLTQRFPHLYPIIKKASKIDTHKFSIIVAEEFIIVSTCCTISIYTGQIIYWYCCLAAFSLHLLIHLLQFIIWQKYIPAIVTTLCCLPYCIWAIYNTIHILPFQLLVFYAFIGFIIGGINLLIMHRIMI